MTAAAGRKKFPRCRNNIFQKIRRDASTPNDDHQQRRFNLTKKKGSSKIAQFSWKILMKIVGVSEAYS